MKGTGGEHPYGPPNQPHTTKGLACGSHVEQMRRRKIKALQDAYEEGELNVDEKLVARQLLIKLVDGHQLRELIQSNPCLRFTSRMIF